MLCSVTYDFTGLMSEIIPVPRFQQTTKIRAECLMSQFADVKSVAELAVDVNKLIEAREAALG
jgi:hypothetical protein